MNLVTRKAEAKHELLFNKLASGSHLVALLKSILDGQRTQIKLIEVGGFVEQKVVLSCSLRCDQIYNSHSFEYTLLCFLSLA
jgi:hypothetical protein